jgi:hypothetical protein
MTLGCLVPFTPRLAHSGPTGNVVPVGPDTFELTMPPARPVDPDAVRVLGKATRVAANYCARMKRTVVVRDSSVNVYAATRLTFSCVPRD